MTALSDPPRGAEAVLEVIDQERSTLRKWFDGQMRQFDKAAAALGGEAAAPASPAAAPPKPKPKRRTSKSTSPQAAIQRREDVLAWLLEQGGAVATGEIRRALDLSAVQVKTATTRLEQAGKIKRTGTGSTTKYEAIREGATPPPVGAPPVLTPPSGNEGTLQGRILNAVQSRGFATLGDLVQVTGGGSEEVLEVCGLLIREEEIRMERRNGNPGYVPV